MKFSHVNLDRLLFEFERYLPSAFDESLTTLQKVQKIYYWLQENVKLTNEMVDYLNQFIEEFDENLYNSMYDILTQWLNDGTLINVIQELLKYEYNIKYYGAKGDGVTNDAEALQTAIDRVHDLGGGSIVFPNGVYIIETPEIVLKSNVSFRLENGSTIYCANTHFRGKATGKGYGSGVNNFSITGGTIKGDFYKYGMGQLDRATKFTFHHSEGLSFKDVTFEEMAIGHVIDMCGCKDVVFNGCTFKGRYFLESTPELDYKEAIQIDHSSNASLGSDDESAFVDGLPTINVTVEGCQFLPIFKNGELIFYAPVAMGNHSQFPRAPKNIVFRNNYLESVNVVAATDWTEKFSGWVHFSTVQDLIIEGNVFNNKVGNRSSAFTCRDRQMHLSNESENPNTKEYEQIKNITFRNNEIRGFNSGGQTGMHGIFSVRGWYGYKEIENIIVTGNKFIDCGSLAQWSNEKRPLDCISLNQVKTATVNENYFYNVDRVMQNGGPITNSSWTGETSLLFSGNYVDEVGYATVNANLFGGTYILSNNMFKNVSGSIRLSGNIEKIITENNTFFNSKTRSLDNEFLIGVTENFKNKFISVAGSADSYITSKNNLFFNVRDVTWEYAFHQSTSKSFLRGNNNEYQTTYFSNKQLTPVPVENYPG